MTDVPALSLETLALHLELHLKYRRGEPGGVRFVAGSANLEGANLRGANLEGAYLRGAYLEGAYLGGAYLEGAKINWQSHWLLSEILFRAAGKNIQRRMIAGLIRISTDWCWEKFLTIDIDVELRLWALKALEPYAADSEPPAEYRAALAQLPLPEPEA